MVVADLAKRSAPTPCWRRHHMAGCRRRCWSVRRRGDRRPPSSTTKDQDKIWFSGTIIAALALVLARPMGRASRTEEAASAEAEGIMKRHQRGIFHRRGSCRSAGLACSGFHHLDARSLAGPDRYRRRAGLQQARCRVAALRRRDAQHRRRAAQWRERRTHPGHGLDAAEAADHEPAATSRRPRPLAGFWRRPPPQSVLTAAASRHQSAWPSAPANPHAPLPAPMAPRLLAALVALAVAFSAAAQKGATRRSLAQRARSPHPDRERYPTAGSRPPPRRRRFQTRAHCLPHRLLPPPPPIHDVSRSSAPSRSGNEQADKLLEQSALTS